MLLLIDNYDSFTFNLVQVLETLKVDVVVRRNNSISVEECLNLKPAHILIGPGPGEPSQAGISNVLIKRCEGIIPILGVCLGHQGIAEVYGGEIIRARSGPMHGKTSQIHHKNQGVFFNLPQPFTATRYHSLAVKKETFPDCLEVTAYSEDGEIMALRHRNYPTEGVQFHPESILTKSGIQLLENFIKKENLCSKNSYSQRWSYSSPLTM